MKSNIFATELFSKGLHRCIIFCKLVDNSDCGHNIVNKKIYPTEVIIEIGVEDK